MAFGDAQVHVGVADEREAFLSAHPMSAFGHAHILKRELLLVDGGRCQQSGFNAAAEPLGRAVADVAHLIDALNLVRHALGSSPSLRT